MIAQVWPISTVRASTLVLIFAALLFSSQLALAQFTQQGPKLVGTGAVSGALQGWSVTLSADGTTAMVGGYGDNSYAGAAWVFVTSLKNASILPAGVKVRRSLPGPSPMKAQAWGMLRGPRRESPGWRVKRLSPISAMNSPSRT